MTRRARNPAPIVQVSRAKVAGALGRVSVFWIDEIAPYQQPPHDNYGRGWTLSLYRGARRAHDPAGVAYGRASFRSRGPRRRWTQTFTSGPTWIGEVDVRTGAVGVTHRMELGDYVAVAPPTGCLALPDYVRLMEMVALALRPRSRR
jgi:hypothetical protein